MTTINIEEIRKTKKNEPKVFPSILTVDREAFGKLDDQVYILKSFWRSSESKIILAKKSDTQSIIGYASYLEMDGGCYLMRIAVRGKCQRHGVGRKIMNYLFEKYPKYLSLDVSTDNKKAISFYTRIGLNLVEKYLSEEKVEFAKFETPVDFINILSESNVKNQRIKPIMSISSKQIISSLESNLSSQSQLEGKQKELTVKSDSDIETQSSKSETSEINVNLLQIENEEEDLLIQVIVPEMVKDVQVTLS